MEGEDMIRAGDLMENPATGERLLFLETAAETKGEYVRFETVVEPNGFVAAAHVHPYQSERFEVVSGRLTVKRGRETIEAGPGEVVEIEPGVPHRFWNAGDEEVRFMATVRPALEFERLIETMFLLAQDGRTNRKGMPNPLRLAVIADAHFDVVRLPHPPVWAQRLGLALGAPLGRLLGYSATYEPAGGALVPANA